MSRFAETCYDAILADAPERQEVSDEELVAMCREFGPGQVSDFEWDASKCGELTYEH